MGGGGSERDPQIRIPLLRRVGEKVGLLVSPVKQAEIDRQNQLTAEEEARYNAYREKLIDSLLFSSACTGKMEYLLGRIDYDLHPDEEVDYDPNHPNPGTYESYLDSISRAQEQGDSATPANIISFPRTPEPPPNS